MIKRLIHRLSVMMVMVASSGALAAQTIEVVDPWIREAPPVAMTLAAYMVVRNQGEAPRTLVGVHASAFGMAMLHQSKEQDGLATMVHVDKLEIPPGGETRFAPGGYHIMLMRPKKALKAGDKVGVDLEFANGETMNVEFVVRRP